MTIKVGIKHTTEYLFEKPITVNPHIIRLRPAPHCRTPIESYSLKITPEKHFINWQQDPFGNYLARLVFPEKTRSLIVDVDLIANMTVINPFDFFLEDVAEKCPFKYDAQLQHDLGPYLQKTEQGPLLKAWMATVDRTPRATVPFLVDLNMKLASQIKYLVRMEPGVQSCEETLKLGSGSCRDSGWLLVQILRQLGLAARFVSGYLVQLAADVAALDGPSGPAQDFTDLHAWAEVYLPGAGWVGLDPTSGLFAGEGHIPLACTPEPITAAAISGSTEPTRVDFRFFNEVSRVHEDPRVTRPYSEDQWQRIVALGEHVDKKLTSHDVRLTMGGEPTFVSIDDMEGAEWNTLALGEKKRELANQLLRRLKARFGPGGLLHIGQGKWYPGEPLPRWALSLIWRNDGLPIWNDDQWLASESDNYGYGIEHAEKFVKTLCKGLGLKPEYLVPGYEDVQYYMWKEGRLPENTDPLDNKLTDPLERKRLARLFKQELNKVIGYALPLKWKQTDKDEGHWKSSRWPFRLKHMFLLAGDSPMGLRLPLDSLPWQAPDPLEFDSERDPFDQHEALPQASDQKPVAAKQPIQDQDDDQKIVHTALCIEPRNGQLYVFMPPFPRAEQYLDVIQVLEATAKKCKTRIIIEGYMPPHDPRLKHLQITPDPGVIEVNVQPASSWAELRDITETLYAEARLTRLGTEKFMLDGKHSGTGGGNHVTMGSGMAVDSPFLRRPDLLASLISYWQHHPSLSYLFSGMFIGPTSQAPRVDEARDDNLYELEIAMALLPSGDSEQPWLVDRVLRNFLVDLTGNTHRSEFCIDKLYSPDGPAGRRGLVEFRAFEMPPHARMGLLQILLLRALIARFWDRPYKRSLIRWGTDLHDRFMLRHYIHEDFKSVISDLGEHGYKFNIHWFAPFLEFRFPAIGAVTVAGIHLQLHTALEPWHVLGEESTAQGTSRYVDSSVERMQISVSNLVDNRYVITCNGRQIPLYPTGIAGNYVAGIRYKAWQPWSSLHPTIKPHAPLVFDIVDTLNQRSIGGCTYHVSHPGGRNYDTFPVNANEAEARRNARFQAYGYTQGKLHVTPEQIHPDHPVTLDLRVPKPVT